MDREAVYRRKLDFLAEELDLLAQADPTATGFELRGVLYSVQVSIEVAMDLAAMIVKDLGRTVGDDYQNIAALQEAKVITPGVAETLRSLNGLRNAIVHKYNHFEEERVFDSLEQILTTLESFAAAAEAR